MSRAAQAAVLFLLGAVLLRTGAGDTSLRYVKEALRPLLLASGAVLVATAGATAWYAHRERRAAPHGTAHPAPRVSWLLLLPVLALVLVAPPALGSYSAMRAGTALQRPPAFPPLPPGDPVPLGLADYAARAVYDDARSLDGRRVRVTGFVALGGDGTPYLVRMTLDCCAADAQPVKVALTGRVPPVLNPDGWLEVTGTATGRRTRDPVNARPVPYLDVERARPVPAPRNPYADRER
ncbi:TIGR03943 family protein [Streptomyces sp. NPDC052687]|uniref:TIGR03943 family putative permease subunit n=1 Tax=Streptomyces sp. NPDC052687 TaxID=3154759 RepID=UPI0034140D78